MINQCCCGDANWVEIATFCSVVIGGAFAWWQWRQSCRVSRAEHLNTILKRYHDKKMTDLFYRLVSNPPQGGEGSEVFYQGEFHFQTIKGKKSPEDDICENDIDSMLTLLSQICYEHERGTISEEEFVFFSYHTWRTLAHKQFKKYLLDFAKYCGEHRIGCPYLALIREGVKVDRAYYERALELAGCRRHEFIDKVKEVLP